jgi:hypothetical protein
LEKGGGCPAKVPGSACPRINDEEKRVPLAWSIKPSIWLDRARQWGCCYTAELLASRLNDKRPRWAYPSRRGACDFGEKCTRLPYLPLKLTLRFFTLRLNSDGSDDVMTGVRILFHHDFRQQHVELDNHIHSLITTATFGEVA